MVGGHAMQEAFSARLRNKAPHLSSRPEQQADRAFLTRLFLACTPLRDELPPPLLLLQAEAQRTGHEAAFPDADRHIISRGVSEGHEPIGRIVIDWTTSHSHVIDVAVLPDARATGAGLAMLRAWIAAADAVGRPCRLQVLATNPAARLYRRLGFRPVSDAGDPAFLAMVRPCTAA